VRYVNRMEKDHELAITYLFLETATRDEIESALRSSKFKK
jgi:hypothetical protein